MTRRLGDIRKAIRLDQKVGSTPSLIVTWPSSNGPGHTGIVGCDGKIYSAIQDGIARWNSTFSLQQFLRYTLTGRNTVYREPRRGTP
jgi:hypothetical protein